MAIKIACGTNDGTNFTKEHFGDSKFFLIYDLDENSFVLREKIENKTEEEEVHGDPKKAAKIAEILNGIDVLVAFAMGPNITRMKKKFVPVISRIENIESALKKLQEKLPEIKEELQKEDKKIIFLKEEKPELTKENVLSALKEVIDPEIKVNLVDLGLIYGVEIEDDKVKIKLTFTTPTCPLGMMILAAVESKIKEKFNVDPDIELIFDPPWTPDRMSEEAKRLTGYKGEQSAQDK